jgi:RES domain-containing protein
MQLTQTRLIGLAFRATSPRYSDLHKTAAMSRIHPGRFNTSDVGAAYVSRAAETGRRARKQSWAFAVMTVDARPRLV